MNSIRNYAVANVTDEVVTKGKKYSIVSMHDTMICINVNGVLVNVPNDDPDFTFYINQNDIQCTPEKPFLLVYSTIENESMCIWCESEEQLKQYAKNLTDKKYLITSAIEIKSCRNVSLE